MWNVGTTLNHVGTTLQEPPRIEEGYTRNASLCFPECFCQKLGTTMNHVRNHLKFKTVTDGIHVCACRPFFFYNTKEKPGQPGTTPWRASVLVL